MIRRVGAGVVAILALCLCSTAAAHAAERKSCRAKDSDTLASSRYARVYEKATTDGEEVDGAKLVACIRKTGKRIRLETAEDDGLVISEAFSQVQLRGRYVAWYFTREDSSCKAACPPNYDATTEEVKVLNLRSRKRREAFATVAGDSLVLTRVGGIAWAEGSANTAEVHALDKDGERTLDRGAIDTASLRAEISIVSWIKSGVEYFARLR